VPTPTVSCTRSRANSGGPPKVDCWWRAAAGGASMPRFTGARGSRCSLTTANLKTHAARLRRGDHCLRFALRIKGGDDSRSAAAARFHRCVGSAGGAAPIRLSSTGRAALSQDRQRHPAGAWCGRTMRDEYAWTRTPNPLLRVAGGVSRGETSTTLSPMAACCKNAHRDADGGWKLDCAAGLGRPCIVTGHIRHGGLRASW